MSRLSDFLDEYPTKATRDNYSATVRNFLAFKYGFDLQTKHGREVLERQRQEAEALVERYFTENNNYAQDYREYCKWTAGRYKPKSCQMYYSIVKQFFLFNDIALTHKEEKSIKRQVPKGGSATKDRLPTLEMVEAFLLHGNLKLKALTLLLISSGLRIDEALKLHTGDVELCEDYGIVHVKRCSNDRPRITFCSAEAVSALREWYKIRDGYIAGINSRMATKENVSMSDRDRERLVFGFGDVHARDLLRAALERAGLRTLDPDTGRQTIHFHLFRKFFETTCKTYIPPMYAEIWVGHQSEVNRAYDIPSLDKQIELYLQAEPYLRVFDHSGIATLKTRADIEAAKEEMRDMKIENLELRSRFGEMEKQNERVLREVETLRRIIDFAERRREGA